MDMIKPQEAARLMSISYPTLKQWIYQGKIHSIKTPGGHHRIPRAEVERVTGMAGLKTRKPAGLQAISGRNKLLGVVTEVRFEGLLAQVTINVGGQHLTSIITRDACEELGLKK